MSAAKPGAATSFWGKGGAGVLKAGVRAADRSVNHSAEGRMEEEGAQCYCWFSLDILI